MDVPLDCSSERADQYLPAQISNHAIPYAVMSVLTAIAPETAELAAYVLNVIDRVFLQAERRTDDMIPCGVNA